MVDFKDRKTESSGLNWFSVKEQIPDFIDNLIQFGHSVGLDGIEDLVIDHVGLRIAGIATTDRLRKEIEAESGSKRISRALVNRRRILNFKVKGLETPCVEVPYPSVNHDFPEDGLEHAEFVLPLEEGENIESAFLKRFPNFMGRYKMSRPTVKSEQLDNTTIIVENPANKMQCIKIHAHSIEEVVRSGKKLAK